jgi:hypothetical protein
MTGTSKTARATAVTLAAMLLVLLTAGGATATTRAVVLQPCGTGQCAAYKPRPLIITIGPLLELKHVRWKTWGNTARATGYLRACDVGCWSEGHATVILHDVRRNHYAKLSIIGGHNVSHYFYWSWLAHCFQAYA